MTRGKFFVLEGIDGAGTTTQTRLLSSYLTINGLNPLATAEPSQYPAGQLIRHLLRNRVQRDALDAAMKIGRRTLAELFYYDRWEHVKEEIEPALAQGRPVVCDRYLISSAAYQSMDILMEEIIQMHNGILAPDITFFLSVPSKVGYDRVNARGEAKEIFEHEETLSRVARAYDEAIEKVGKWQKVVTIDGTLKPEQIFAKIRESIDPIYGLG